MTAQQMRSPSPQGVARAAAKIAQLLPATPLLELQIGGATIWAKVESLQPLVMEIHPRRMRKILWLQELGSVMLMRCEFLLLKVLKQFAN